MALFKKKKKEEELAPPPLPPEGLPSLPPLPEKEELPEVPTIEAPPALPARAPPELPEIEIPKMPEVPPVPEAPPMPELEAPPRPPEIAPPRPAVPERATVFIRIDKYKDVMKTIARMQDKLDELQRTLGKISTIKTRESEIVQGWNALLQEAKSKIDEVSSKLLKPGEH